MLRIFEYIVVVTVMEAFENAPGACARQTFLLACAEFSQWTLLTNFGVFLVYNIKTVDCTLFTIKTVCAKSLTVTKECIPFKKMSSLFKYLIFM